MKIAIPTVDGLLCPHFGHCQQFAIVEVDTEKRDVISQTMITPPPHEPGILPQWISQQGCTVVIVGGMGGRALAMFNQSGITVVSGASSQEPKEIVLAYLNGELITGGNLCDGPIFRQGGHTDCAQHE